MMSYKKNKSLAFKAGSNATFSAKKRDELMKYCKNIENSSHAEASCAALIQNDGWKISDDYPFKL